MARQARVLSPKGLYYIELKGERLFLRPEDKEKFLEIASECFADGKIYGAFLSDTLIKMVVKTNDISAVMKSLSVKYARYINRLAQTSGKIFSGRFKSVPFGSVTEAEKAAAELDADYAPKAEKPEAKPKKPAKRKAAGKPAPEKAAKKTAVEPAPEKAAEPETPKTPAAKKKNLPSWLL